MKTEACTAKVQQTVVHQKKYNPPTVEKVDRYCEREHGHKNDHMFYYEGQERTFPKDPEERR